MKTVRLRHQPCLVSAIGVCILIGLLLALSRTSDGPISAVTSVRVERISSPDVHETRNVTALVNSSMFQAHGLKLRWIGERIRRMSDTWNEAYVEVKRNHSSHFSSPKRILVLPGLLTEYSSYNFAVNAYKGGYLGELVQWSDLIAGLYLLHSNLTIITSIESLKKLVQPKPGLFDLVITDYIGLVGMHSANLFGIYKCRLRVLDSFGTEPMSVFRTYTYAAPDIGDSFNVWNFEHFKQIWTYYPHTPDNSFLGTAVVKPKVANLSGQKLNRGLIYGKSAQYLRILGSHDVFLNTIGQYMELHSTFVEGTADLPATHIINHGVLSQGELQEFLQSSKLFVGLGFPYDGPGAVEALANGCPFIQPKFDPPFSKKNNAFFKGKPTSREVTSQHPYLEHFIGEPYVYTIDIRNTSAIEGAVMSILEHGDLAPFIPFELTAQGFLTRLGSMIHNEDYCDGKDVAVSMKAYASSNHGNHHPSEAVDGLLTHDSCWWSSSSLTSWWALDMRGDTYVRKIRIVIAPNLYIAKSWQNASPCPFQVSLFSSSGKEIAKKVFTVDRAVHVWDNVHVEASTIHIETIVSQAPKFMVLCAVEVYEGAREPPVWPSLDQLIVKVSKPGQSCKDACFAAKMVCEPVYFKYINTAHALITTFKCARTVESSLFADFFPAQCIEENKDHQIAMATCVLNQEPTLLSCAGQHNSYIRLCPCRQHDFGKS